MMNLWFWDICVLNFMIKSCQIRKIILKAALVFLGKGREVQMGSLVNSAKWAK